MIFGSKPTVPEYRRTDLAQQQAAAVSANQRVLPQAERLASQANTFSIGQINSMLENVMPGFRGMTETASSNINSMLRGEIPTDVSTAVQNSAAARSLGGGFGGSPMARNLVARDLGMTSLGLTERGLSSMEGWMRTAASIYEPSMMNITSMFVSPEQMYRAEQEQNTAQFQQQWMQNQIAAMPDPVMAGINAEIMSLMTSYLGGGTSKASDFQQNYSGVGRSGIGANLSTNYGGGMMDSVGPGMDSPGSFDTVGAGMDFSGGSMGGGGSVGAASAGGMSFGGGF